MAMRTEPADDAALVHEYRPDTLDLRIVHAVQIEPRASWAEIAPVVGADPATVSRRWERLRRAGLVWVTGVLDPGSTLALVEITCAPGDLHATAQALSADPEVVIVDYTLGGRDLLVTVVADSPRGVADYVLGPVVRLPGVRSARTHLCTERLLDARRWRLRELTAGETARVPRQRPPRARSARSVPADLRAAIGRELAVDGRAPAAEIARRTGFTAQRVTDAIATLRADGDLHLRADLARDLSDWPVYAWYFVQVPAPSIAQARITLAQVPEIRLAALCASRFNLVLAVWLRSVPEVQDFEVALARALPGSVVADRSVVVRTSKHLGHLLDGRGRATGDVVLAFG